jgi:hypothetical protein
MLLLAEELRDEQGLGLFVQPARLGDLLGWPALNAIDQRFVIASTCRA